MLEQAAAGEKKSPHRTFRRILTSFLVIDAFMVALLVSGFLIPARSFHNVKTTGLRAETYDDSAKVSPFTPLARDPVRTGAGVPLITARGAHSALIPAPDNGQDSEAAHQSFDDLSVISAGDEGIPPAARPALRAPGEDTPRVSPRARVEPVVSPHTS
jgi:hypothetical protein